MNKLLIALGMIIPLAGCSAPVRSLQPLIPEKQAIALPDLSGTWVDAESAGNEEDDAVWTFEEKENHEYKWIGRSAKEESSYVFTVRFARLGGYLFVDAIFDEATVRGEKVDSDAFWVPVHYFGRFEVSGDEIHARLLGEDWLKPALKEGRTDLRRETLEQDNVILTAPTPELQEFVIQHAWDDEVFCYQIDLSRRRPTE